MHDYHSNSVRSTHSDVTAIFSGDIHKLVGDLTFSFTIGITQVLKLDIRAVDWDILKKNSGLRLGYLVNIHNVTFICVWHIDSVFVNVNSISQQNSFFSLLEM